MKQPANALLQAFDFPPFDQIQAEDFVPAIQELIQATKAELEALAHRPEAASFENTLEPLAYLGRQLDEVSSILFNLNSAETNAGIQAAAKEAAPLLTAFHNDVLQNEALFERIKAVVEMKPSLGDEAARYLDLTFKNFIRNGALLSAEKKEVLRSIDERLSLLGLTFSEHVLNDINAFSLHFTDDEKLQGLPENTLEEARQKAVLLGKEGYILSLHAPVYQAVMAHAHNRDLRKVMATAWGRRGFQDNPNNNTPILEEIAKLRLERAQLLGYRTHADYVLQERMAERPIKVMAFLDDLKEKALPAAERDFEDVAAYARERGHEGPLEAWDISYYSERLKEHRHQLEVERVRAYFPLERVLQSAFEVAGKLYGLHFEQTTSVPVYHPEVETWMVTSEDGRHMATLYSDFFPREGKRAGAWKTSYRKQAVVNGQEQRPLVSIVCNFTRPTPTKPALLTFEEVKTLFHEFGHALHSILADTRLPGLSGTQVFWDFVELPSQIMENWCTEPEVLTSMARHYATQEELPQEMMEAIVASSHFLEGLATLRQLGFGYLDMAWHNQARPEELQLSTLEDKAMAPTRLWKPIPGTAVSPAFSHLFSGGYSAGYYSYKWAEVLDADAFERFKEEGIFDPQVARDFKTLLSMGGKKHPMDLYRAFRGREPRVEALLLRSGLATLNA